LEKEEKVKKKKNKFLRVVGWIFLSLLILLIGILLFVRSPWGQGIIVNKVVSYISDKTYTKVSLDKVFITFSGDIQIEGLYLEDKNGDTLIYSKILDADIPLIPLIKGSGVEVNSLNWDGLKVNIIRKDSIKGFNFQFLVDAFATTDSTAVDTSTTSDPMNLKLGDFKFNNFKISFEDQVGGIEADLQIEEFLFEMEETNMEEMRFNISKARLKNSSIVYIQTKPFPESEEESSSPMPFIVLEDLEIENISAYYSSSPDGLATKLDIGLLNTSIPKMDLQNNVVLIEDILLKESDIILEVNSIAAEKEKEVPQDIESSLEEFVWPNWEVQVNKVSFIDNEFTYLVDGAKIQAETYNQNALAVSNLNFEATNIYFKNETAGASIDKLTFKESSGLNLEEFKGNLELTDTKLDLNGLQIKLNENVIDANATIAYNSITELMNNPEEIDLNAEISNFAVDMKDLFVYMPELNENEYIKALSAKNLSGQLNIDGSGKALSVSNASINWGNSTSLNANGTISNPMDVDNLNYNFSNVNFRSTRKDLNSFVKEEDLGIEIPNSITKRKFFWRLRLIKGPILI